jgi:hypothetical protein
VLPVTLASGGMRCPGYAVVDSGADDCIFPASYAARIGLDLTAGRRYSFTGVGPTSQEAYFFDVRITIPGTSIDYPTSVGFTSALNRNSLGGLLGQNGFFDRFKINFDRARGLFTLDVPESL